MRQLDRSSWPPRWKSNLSPAAWLGLLIVVGGAIYCGTLGAAAARAGSCTATLTMGGFAVCCAGYVAALTTTFLVSATRYTGVSARGTVVRVNPLIAWMYGLASLGAILSTSLYLAFANRDDVRPLLGSFGGGTVTRFLMAALLAISLIGLIALLRTRETGRLRIGPSGVQHDNMFRSRSATWDDFIEITDGADTNTRNPIVFTVRDAKRIVVGNADRYGSSGPALYWMVRHYWKHPEDRDELSDGRALERLRSDRFTPQ